MNIQFYFLFFIIRNASSFLLKSSSISLNMRSLRLNKASGRSTYIPLSMVSNEVTSASEEEIVETKSTGNIFTNVVSLLGPGEGQSYGDRESLHQAGATRKWTDPIMWTHICFVFAVGISMIRGLYDMALITAMVIPLSLLYHYTYEKPGTLAKVEGTMAKLLFVYGIAQIFNCPLPGIKGIEILFLLAVSGVFVGTNLNKKFYEPWHCMMHVLPPMWSIFVAAYHQPIIKFF